MKNVVEEMADRISEEHPEIKHAVSRPLREDGVWFLDVYLDNQTLNVEKSPKRPFWITSLSLSHDVEDAPTEVIVSNEDAVVRIMKIVRTGELTKAGAR